jgi:hypothetical protein
MPPNTSSIGIEAIDDVIEIRPMNKNHPFIYAKKEV